MCKNLFGSLMVVLLFACTPAWADKTIDLTEPRDSRTVKIAKEIDRLFERLAKAKDEIQARAVENQIWKNWMALPAPKIRALVKQAMEARRSYNFAKAKKLLDQVIKLAPEYAEGWNQRAFILFLQEKFDEALSDTEKALELEPRHFGAMAGQGQILMGQGRFATGQAILKKAVKIHPFLRERSMIVEIKEENL